MNDEIKTEIKDVKTNDEVTADEQLLYNPIG
jgi:hypothetical protein